MLQPQNRLKKVRDFNLLMKNGKWINGQFLDVKILSLKHLPDKKLPKRVGRQEFITQLKIAFTVGVKIDKRAVVRNRLRRQIREAVRLLIKEKKIPSGYYVLFVARAGIRSKEYAEISKEIRELLLKAGLLEAHIT